MPDNQYITPAEAYESMNEKMIRIPEQFPSASPMLAVTVSNTTEKVAYNGIKGNVISFAAPLSVATTLTLAIDNFHERSRLCMIDVPASAADASLSVSLLHADPLELPLSADKASLITLMLVSNADGELGVAVAGITTL